MNLENTAALDWPYGHPKSGVTARKLIYATCSAKQTLKLAKVMCRRGWGPGNFIRISDILSVKELPLEARIQGIHIVLSQNPLEQSRKSHNRFSLACLRILGMNSVLAWQRFDNRLRFGDRAASYKDMRAFLRKLYGNW